MCETTADRTEFTIPESNLSNLQERLEKLSRRAVKLGLVGPSITVLETIDSPVQRRDVISGAIIIDHYTRSFRIRLDGQAPTIPGWALVAVIEHTGDSEIGNVVRTVPGQSLPLKYRQAASWCDHCRTSRRRTETFVIVNPAGEHRQIGRNCLADFCRDASAASAMCTWAEIVASAVGLCEGSEDDGFFGCGSRGVSRASTESVLAVTSRIIRHTGWLPKSKCDEYSRTRPTSSIVSDVFFDPKFFDVDSDTSNERRELIAAVRDVDTRDNETATRAIEWIRSLRSEASNLNDYMFNLLVIASEETVTAKHFGLLCSLVATYQREVEKIETAKRQSATSRHLGTVGKRETFNAAVLSVRPFESQWGCKYLVKLDVDGATVIWWCSTEFSANPGESIEIKGTVKGHGDYQGIKQTELTRCKVRVLESA